LEEKLNMKNKNILVVAAHSDEEILGMGSIITNI